uniref:Ammonium transporter n=1 Tax=Chromera velia CCMP2878 TaxID=1169474 RepID=A0A0G4HW70_9ALVE|eukprot:Cvel_8996.t1-p1 / transcript=Cvel_8996.t1 / gene=Cvel_8996 / organism=Chromera_velia_CCMP2878 / gene_product=Putative ammonium transporter 1, putative / transcript_product=Putative ammonium transporter 1, putative / location=Cvel_scaffold508:52976-59250(-) / protein_length=636 / sequence_SO=supercontig / SO=protein_coding / is_pseudo=false
MTTNTTEYLLGKIDDLTATMETKIAEDRYVSDTIFLILMGGFAFVEGGLLSSKNIVNILVKNFLDAAVGAISYWLVGYGLAFGDGGPFIGENRFILIGMPDNEYAFFFFQYTFAATSGTIVSGAIAERADLRAYLFYSVALAAFVYPVATHWIWWEGGWLYDRGFIDFAGSAVVHSLGGSAALCGSLILGPRLNRFVRDERGRIIHNPESIRKYHAPHSIPFFVLGAFILWVGFLGFNGGSNIVISTGDDGTDNGAAVSKVIANTILSGSAGCLFPMFFEYATTRRWSIVATISGTVAGMAAVCSAVGSVDPWEALVIGMVGGGVNMGVSKLLVRLGIDDPVDAIPIHLGGGAWGCLAAGLFGEEAGLFWTGSFEQLGVQTYGLLAVVAWAAGLAGPLFLGLYYAGIFRVDPLYELAGQDIHKHSEAGYLGLQAGANKEEENKKQRRQSWWGGNRRSIGGASLVPDMVPGANPGRQVSMALEPPVHVGSLQGGGDMSSVVEVGKPSGDLEEGPNGGKESVMEAEGVIPDEAGEENMRSELPDAYYAHLRNRDNLYGTAPGCRLTGPTEGPATHWDFRGPKATKAKKIGLDMPVVGGADGMSSMGRPSGTDGRPSGTQGRPSGVQQEVREREREFIH